MTAAQNRKISLATAALRIFTVLGLVSYLGLTRPEMALAEETPANPYCATAEEYQKAERAWRATNDHKMPNCLQSGCQRDANGCCLRTLANTCAEDTVLTELSTGENPEQDGTSISIDKKEFNTKQCKHGLRVPPGSTIEFSCLDGCYFMGATGEKPFTHEVIRDMSSFQ